MRAKKKLGQHFLRSGTTVHSLIEKLDAPKRATVLEIGPGNGVITNQLLQQGYQVLAVELDYDVLGGLIKRFAGYMEQEKFDIIHKDILHTDIAEEIEKAFPNTSTLYITGNLPFNISKKIIHTIKALHFARPVLVANCSFIVQNEVAKQFVANSPHATKLGTLLSLWATAKKHETLSPQNFIPQPKVASAILEITPRTEIDVHTIRTIETLVQAGFNAPRKTLRNNLSNGLQLEKETITQALTKAGLPEKVRAEALTLQDWSQLAQSTLR